MRVITRTVGALLRAVVGAAARRVSRRSRGINRGMQRSVKVRNRRKKGEEKKGVARSWGDRAHRHVARSVLFDARVYIRKYEYTCVCYALHSPAALVVLVAVVVAIALHCTSNARAEVFTFRDNSAFVKC